MIKSEDPRLEYMSISNKNKNYLAVYSEMTKKNHIYQWNCLSVSIHLETFMWEDNVSL